MSRLKYEDVNTIPGTLSEFDDELYAKLGCSLEELANRTSGIENFPGVRKFKADALVGIIPVTAGKGVIKGFTEALVSIARHIGFRAMVTDSADTSGFAEAIYSGCSILLMSDDDSFVAYNCRTGTVVDNNPATAYGFVAALEMMINGIEGKEVLVLGAGPIGRYSLSGVLEKGGRVGVYDLNRDIAERAAHGLDVINQDEIMIEGDFESALSRYRYIIDATPADSFIEEADVSKETVVVSPGVPHGLSSTAVGKLGRRFLHDNLRIGAATMLTWALYARAGERHGGPGGRQTDTKNPLQLRPEFRL